MRLIVGLFLVMSITSSAMAQTPAHDPSSRLRDVLPAEVAERVLATIARARALELPAQALEHRALELSAKGAAPADIERRIDAQARSMESAREALERGRPESPSDDEVRAAGEAMERGVDGAAVSALAASATSGRSLTVPLLVLSELMSRGLPADEAVARVHHDLDARVPDEEMRSEAARAARGRPAFAGQGMGAAAVGRPPSVPMDPGVRGRPSATPPVETPRTPPVGGPPPSL